MRAQARPLGVAAAGGSAAGAGGPASKFRRTCNLHACARNRQGKPCSVKVEPGKRRCHFHGGLSRQGKPCSVKVEPGKRICRFHGGLSSGPKTAAGQSPRPLSLPAQPKFV
jgi:hypothetical protein